jgi:hypothetical protein
MIGSKLCDAILRYAGSYSYKTRSELDAIIKKISIEMGTTEEQVKTAIRNMRRLGKLPGKWGFLQASRLTDDRIISTANQNAPACQQCEQEDNSETLISLFGKTNAVSFAEALERLDMSPSMLRSQIEDHRSRGTEIYEHDGIIRLGVAKPAKLEPLGTKNIVFGVASDIHFGSKACQITALNKFVDRCKAEGVRHIICPGDMVDGAGIYKGQELEQYAITADAQEQSAIYNLPMVKLDNSSYIDWLLLGGNHDYSFMNGGRGHNPCRSIETQREDVKFIGFDREKIPILPGVDAMTWHGRGNAAYAKSYKLQNHARNLAYSEMRKFLDEESIGPTIRFLFGGHWHIFCHTIEGAIDAILCGSFAGENGLTRQLGVDPVICGLIVWADIVKGRVCRIRIDVCQYPEIKDDWKNYKHELEYSKPKDPLFV